MTLAGELERKLLWSEDQGYEQARRDAVWNGRKPPRRPAGIVLAEDAADVATAVRLAQERGLQVSVRAGGHSTSAAGVREGALLIDVSRLSSIDIEARARTAVVGPGAIGQDLDLTLDPLGLLFPHGHCSTVAVGGFLLGGGLGWNWRAYGPGCGLVRAVDVVTADGEVVRADESQNSDLYWAARGAGPGFFGIVTAFHLEMQPKPAVIKAAAHNYPFAARGELLSWLHEIRHEMSPIVDQALCVTQHVTHSPDGPTMLLGTVAFADSEREADDALALFTNAPLRQKAIWGDDGTTVGSVQHLTGVDDLYPAGLRYAHDNIMSSAAASALVPALDAALTSLPTPRSHINWQNLAGVPELPDMAFSLLGDTLIEVVAVGDDPSQDAQLQSWVTDHARQLEPVAVGSQIGADSMASRGLGPDAYFSADALSRLGPLRDRWDPDRRFVSFLLGETPSDSGAR
ncbi:FAD-binding oxidoreductase [Streptomyces sp. NBC_01352]|uniref:FAD-binding oxidoreductase n=1 Tax=unclassified Streptomyces TaxID=2593676 RepID=UPI0022557AD1|nr:MULTISPECIES: FAD-binding oxidoreductase [unclassified Streptomyces]MCX4706651.1 FAD-binding oxidoreductase [Streptomyces sp. NBC_01373]